MNLHQWAARWNIPQDALTDLRRMFGHDDTFAPLPNVCPPGEAGVQLAVRMEAAVKGCRLFRNNVGALQDKDGRHVRYGLANDSAQMNKQIKSADLIGVRPVTITPAHVGTTIGQFISREAKEPGWKFTGTDREVAQQRWAELVISLGGDARFATGQGTL